MRRCNGQKNHFFSQDTMVISNKILEYSSVESIPNLDNLRKKHSEKMFLIMRQGAVPLKKKTPRGVKVIQGENLESVGFDPSGFEWLTYDEAITRLT